MHLHERDVQRFYGVWFPLLHFVNQHRKIVPDFPSTWSRVSAESVLPLRTQLWQEDALREAFIAENPARLPPDDLALVDSWKHRVEDRFFVLRHLKKHTLFLGDQDPGSIYGVVGIISPLHDVVGPYLPLLVEAVLLPFEDRIIYDSIIAPYPLQFGPGYRASFRNTYRQAQERGAIITQLPVRASANTSERVQKSNKKILNAFQKALGAAGLSPKRIEEHHNALATFASTYLERKTPPGLLMDLTPADLEAYWETQNGKVNRVSFKRFVWFLRDSERISWDTAEMLLEWLKRR